VSLILSGCVTSGTNKGARGSKARTEYLLYANVGKVDGKYIITKISHSKSGKSVMMIRLDDLSYIGGTDSVDCGLWTFGKRYKHNTITRPYCTDPEPYFRVVKINKGKTLAIGVLSLGTYSVLGANKRSSYFDEDEFNRAIKDIQASYDIKGLLNKSKNESLRYKKELLSAKSTCDEYNRLVREYIKIEPVIKDLSGFYKGGKIDLIAEGYIRTNKCSVTDNFYKIFHVASGKPSELSQYLENIHPDSNRSDSVKFSYSGKSRLGDYNVSIMMPSKNISLPRAEDKIVKFMVKILSKDLHGIGPKHYANSDKSLKIASDNGTLTLTNNTSSFITINSISVYRDKDITTSSSHDIELPPNSEKRLSGFGYKGKDFLEVTKRKLSRKSMKYGFAIKYTVVNSNVKRTLYKVDRYKVLSLI